MTGRWTEVPYFDYGPPPDNDPGWIWLDPVPWVDEFGFWHPGFGRWKRPLTRAELEKAS